MRSVAKSGALHGDAHLIDRGFEPSLQELDADNDRTVQLWNDGATLLWGLRGEKVDRKQFTELEIGLPVKVVAESIDAVLDDGGQSTTVSVDAGESAWTKVRPQGAGASAGHARGHGLRRHPPDVRRGRRAPPRSAGGGREGVSPVLGDARKSAW